MRITAVLPILLLLAGLGLSSCQTPIPVARVEARLESTPDVPMTTTLSLSYPVSGPGPRVTASEGTGHTYLMTSTLNVGTPGLTTDSYYLQVFGKPSAYMSDDPSDGSSARTGDTSFIDLHTGDVAAIVHETPSMSSPPGRTITFDPRRSFVSAWLARVEVDDASTPWSVPASDPRCQAMPGGGCFGLSTVAGGMAAGITAALAARVDSPAGAGADADPDLLVRTRGPAALVSYIPNLIPAFDSPTRRVRGVGFIFAQNLQARAVGRLVAGEDVGTTYHDVTVWIPVSILFETDGTGGLLVTFDPFDTGGSSLGQMAGRVAVEVTSPGPGPIEAGVSTVIASSVRSAVSGTLSAPLPASVASSLAAGFFNVDRGGGPLPPDFDVVLVPPSGAPMNGPAVSPQLIPPGPLTGVDLVFLQ